MYKFYDVWNSTAIQFISKVPPPLGGPFRVYRFLWVRRPPPQMKILWQMLWFFICRRLCSNSDSVFLIPMPMPFFCIFVFPLMLLLFAAHFTTSPFIFRFLLFASRFPLFLCIYSHFSSSSNSAHDAFAHYSFILFLQYHIRLMKSSVCLPAFHLAFCRSFIWSEFYFIIL